MNRIRVFALTSAIAASSVASPIGHSRLTSAEASQSTAADCLDADNLPPDSILGEWWTEGKEGRMRFVKAKSGMYEALVVSGKDGDRKDTKNPDPKLRDRTVQGLVIMWHLAFDDGEYVGGYCYNPRDGGTYHLKAKMLAQNSLKIRGYLGIPLLGQNQIWTRVQ